MRSILLVLAATLILATAAASSSAEAPAGPGAIKKAIMKTSLGDVELELWPEVAPETVRVFLGLADGKGTFADVRNPQKKITISKPFYDGLQFHRVIKGFMIQGGCPRGNGTGNPGFMFADEINADALGLDKMKLVDANKQWHPYIAGLGAGYIRTVQVKVVPHVMKELGIAAGDQAAMQKRFPEILKKLQAMSLKQAYEILGYKYTKGLPSQKPVRGTLALANAGPNTNGSQFFVNVGDPVNLSGKHTVFGKVTKGMDVIDKIAGVKTDGPRTNKPVTPVKILSIRSLP